MLDFNILIGGSAGQGMDTLSKNIEKTLLKTGYHIFSNKDYESRVRGGHNFTQIRFSDKKIYSHSSKLDIIIALNKETIEIHKDRLSENGFIICDEDIIARDKNIISIDMKRIAKDLKNMLALNTISFGILIKLLGLDLDLAKTVLKSNLKDSILDSNINALIAGYDSCKNTLDIEKTAKKSYMLINANQSIGLGALAGGVKFYGAYPMTPSTGIMTYLASKQNDSDIVVEQAEDEIAAINMVLGASYAGARSMTGTSGGGLSLMTETIGLSGIAEIPIVIVNVQRPGPATGLPTRTEQSDLSFVLTASHGEIPRMVISVRNAEDAFYQTVRALNLADELQIPVIILSDQYLADANQSFEPFDLSKVTIDTHMYSINSPNEDYKRYKLNETGISPRIIPGKHFGNTVLIDSDEHDETGHIIEDAKTRIDMMTKRMNKINILKEKVLEPNYYGVENPDILLIGWGSTDGSIRESVDTLNKENKNVGALVFGDIYPLPTKLLNKYYKQAKTLVNIEQNYTGQLAKLIRQETEISMDKSLLKFDGRQINKDDIVDFFKKEVF
ncbi:2-oxoacid:acceptor oxidoreductase subunit alpha [Tepidibacter aestuarii]|uniref:2-oxoacid:acceptor oxidoreductase subunit alpha n=1 Tax=Tepidibacter aestuarii TaxID=2925782 RepID=UPI0021118979|nr:2-oxoacid:acceptor oxidoreductase subunit alpha [Tepidibacter aestuarii]CAH2212586.1 2-oxoglutarate/2-oxoacid ferredoxin oxidoreductase subunit alpha [Tepidibacter aestuarii]